VIGVSRRLLRNWSEVYSEGDLGEAVEAHPDFARVRASPGPTTAYVAVCGPTEAGD
jgi:hypothetical protein